MEQREPECELHLRIAFDPDIGVGPAFGPAGSLSGQEVVEASGLGLGQASERLLGSGAPAWAGDVRGQALDPRQASAGGPDLARGGHDGL